MRTATKHVEHRKAVYHPRMRHNGKAYTKLAHIKKAVSKMGGNIADSTKHQTKNVTKYATKNPYKSIAMATAALAGLFIIYFVRRG